MTVEVRPVRPEEFEAARTALRDSWSALLRADDNPDEWPSYIERVADVASRAGHTVVLVAAGGGEILGSVTVEVDRRVEDPHTGGDHDEPVPPDAICVRMLGVRPDAQRRGVGRLLMEACFAEARARGRTRVTLHTTERQTAAQKMYESMGFERLEDRVFDDGFRLLTYELRLG